LEPSKSETKGTVLLTNADELLAYSKGEEQLMEEAIKSIADSGANVIVAGGAVSALALHYCEKFNIMVIKESSKFQLRRICRATGASGLLRLGKPSAEELGASDEVSVEEIGSTRVTVFRNSSERCKVSTILVRGSTHNILDDVERAIGRAPLEASLLCSAHM
jgi:T-complex protein 1 subunit theta